VRPNTLPKAIAVPPIQEVPSVMIHESGLLPPMIGGREEEEE